MKPSTLSSGEREVALRRAIIRAIPEYYAWPEAEQEQYRLNVSRGKIFRIRHFYADCQRITGSITELDALAEHEQQEAFEFLDKNYRDTLDNFDPKGSRPHPPAKTSLNSFYLSQ